MAYIINLFICIRLISLLKCKFFSSSLLFFLFISIELQLNAILDLYIDLTIYTFLIMNHLKNKFELRLYNTKQLILNKGFNLFSFYIFFILLAIFIK